VYNNVNMGLFIELHDVHVATDRQKEQATQSRRHGDLSVTIIY